MDFQRTSIQFTCFPMSLFCFLHLPSFPGLMLESAWLYLKGSAPMPPAPFQLRHGGLEAWWLRGEVVCPGGPPITPTWAHHAPKWARNRLKMAPRWLLGDPRAGLGWPLGGPWPPRSILERFGVPVGTPFGGSKITKNGVENDLKFDASSELYFRPSGGRSEPFWA